MKAARKTVATEKPVIKARRKFKPGTVALREIKKFQKSVIHYHT
jgi:hypothetical protein